GARLRALNACIERAHQHAASEVAGDGEIVAGRVDAGEDQSLDIAAVAEQPDVEHLLGERLTQEGALELAVDVVDRDDDVAGQQCGAQALLELLLISSL